MEISSDVDGYTPYVGVKQREWTFEKEGKETWISPREQHNQHLQMKWSKTHKDEFFSF